jgi:hypothetical protein
MEIHHVHKRLPPKGAALGVDNTYVLLHENGSIAWSGGLAQSLYGEINKELSAGNIVDVVALGRSQGSSTYSSPADNSQVWFLLYRYFHYGYTRFGGACEQSLVSNWWDAEGDRVERVSFALSNGWFKFKRGGEASWKGLPASLSESLDKNRQAEGGVEALSVGHNGEWLVIYKSGQVRGHGLHPTLEKMLRNNNSNRNGDVRWVQLGPDGTFIAVFENYTVWCGNQELTDHLLAWM